MTYTSSTNHFFKKNIYQNLANFAFSPVSWVMEPLATSYPVQMPNYGRLLIGAVLWPILVPATLATFAVSLALAAVSALVHGLALLAAGTLDALTASKPTNTCV